MKNPLKGIYKALSKRKKKTEPATTQGHHNLFGLNFHTWTPIPEEQVQGRTFRDHSFQLVTYDIETAGYNYIRPELYRHLFQSNATDDTLPPMSVHVHTHNDPTTLELIQTKRHPTTPEMIASNAHTMTERIKKEKVTETAKRLLEMARKNGVSVHKLMGINTSKVNVSEQELERTYTKTLENRVRTVFSLMEQANVKLVDDRKEPEPLRNTQETRDTIKEFLSTELSTQNLNRLLDRSIEHHTQQIGQLADSLNYNDRQRSTDQEFPLDHIEITPQGQEAEFRHLVEHHHTVKPKTVRDVTDYLDSVYRANGKTRRTKPTPFKPGLEQGQTYLFQPAKVDKNDRLNSSIGQDDLVGVSVNNDDHLSDRPNNAPEAKRTVLEEFVESHAIIIGIQKDDDVIDACESIVNYFDQISLGERRELANQLRHYIESRLSDSLQERGHETVSLSVYSVFVGQQESLSTSFVCHVGWPEVPVVEGLSVPNRTMIEVKLAEQTFDDLLLECLESERVF